MDAEIFFFMDSVVIVNPDYTIYTDSLKYDTQTEISYFFGPTEILSEERYIYCENGWYDTQNDISFVTDKAFLEEDGMPKYNSLPAIALLEHHVRQDLNETTHRVMGVLEPIKLIIEN